MINKGFFAAKALRHKEKIKTKVYLLLRQEEIYMIAESIEKIGKIIVNSAFKVHKELGPGLLEKVYEVCLAHEIRKAGIQVERQLDIPIFYDGLEFDEGFRLDLLVGGVII